MRLFIIYLTMKTTPDNTSMKTNNEATVMPTKASKDKSEKGIRITKQYTQINFLCIYRNSPNKVTEEAREGGHPMCTKKPKYNLIVNSC